MNQQWKKLMIILKNKNLIMMDKYFILEKLIGISFIVFGALFFRNIYKKTNNKILGNYFDGKGYLGSLMLIVLGISIIIGKWHILK
jgi:hypothetical protein